MILVVGVMSGIAGALLVGAVLGGARGNPGLGLTAGAILLIPILVVSLLGVGAGAALARKGIVWLLGFLYFAFAAAYGLVGLWLFFAAPRTYPDAILACVLSAAALTATGAARASGEAKPQ